MKRLVGAVATTFVLFMAAPAQAEFSAEEKASAARFQNAMNYISMAVAGYIAYTMNSYVTPGSRGVLTDAALVTLQALDEANDGYSALVGDVTTTQEGTSEFVRVETSGRLHRLWITRYRAERLTWLLPWASSLWMAAIDLYGDPTYRDNVWRAADFLRAAEVEIRAFNPALAYFDPAPPTDPRFGSGTVVGPHGDFRRTHWHRWRGRHYLIRSMSSSMQAVKAGGDDMSYGNSGRVLTDLAVVVQMTTNESAATSGLTSTDDVFGRTLQTLHVLQTNQVDVGVPGTFRSWSFDFRDAYLSRMGRSSAFDGWTLDAFMVLADGWSHFDESAWQLNIFKGCPPVCVGGR